MSSVTVAEARKRLYRLLDEVNESHEPLQILGKRGNAVLVSEEDWRSIQEALYLLSIQGMRESIVRGIRTPVEKCAEVLRWRVARWPTKPWRVSRR
ncbi:MAG: type II toxin-antitoxin system Phd/YefM family antitoxin [Phycisphaerae bacterium]|nr:type II toxin-antitoxin system Phd/YefM family antitoxin [Phycisphaerae bacterium]